VYKNNISSGKLQDSILFKWMKPYLIAMLLCLLHDTMGVFPKYKPTKGVGGFIFSFQ
jgi:hypothetical protein